jgi:hypothetical protein
MSAVGVWSPVKAPDPWDSTAAGRAATGRPPTRQARSPRRIIVVAMTLLVGCSSVPIPPTYTQEELRAICRGQGGWWHPDSLRGGYCEYDSRL